MIGGVLGRRGLEFGNGFVADLFPAFVATGLARKAIDPATAAVVAGQFRRAVGIDEDHRQAPRKARPSDSRKSS